MKTAFDHPAIGEVTLSRTRRATRVSLSVRPDGSVRLSYPIHVSHKQALRFLDDRCEWVMDNRRRLEARYPCEPITSYRSRSHALCLRPADVGRISVRIKEGVITVVHPDVLDPGSAEVQEAIRRGITGALRAEAKEFLPAEVGRLAAVHGFRCGGVRVKASRSKWGSCTAANDINLSLFLMLLPDRLVEYIILHELCHTVHKNHSPRFHKLLDSVTGGHSAELNRELRSYRPDIRQPAGRDAGNESTGIILATGKR